MVMMGLLLSVSFSSILSDMVLGVGIFLAVISVFCLLYIGLEFLNRMFP